MRREAQQRAIEARERIRHELRNLDRTVARIRCVSQLAQGLADLLGWKRLIPHKYWLSFADGISIGYAMIEINKGVYQRTSRWALTVAILVDGIVGISTVISSVLVTLLLSLKELCWSFSKKNFRASTRHRSRRLWQR